MMRFVLVFGAFALGAALVVAHGLRGLVALVVLVLLASAPQTRVWHSVEGALVRITGSRTRAAILLLSTVIVVILAFEIFTLFHG